MKVEAILPFDDLQDGVPREPGDVFECTAERYEQINSTEFGQLVKSVEPEPGSEPKPAPAKKAAPKRKTAPKTAKKAE